MNQVEAPKFPSFQLWYMRRPRFVFRMAYPVKKGFALLPMVNSVIQHLRQSGSSIVVWRSST